MQKIKPKILIVEDEVTLAEMYETKFEKEGFKVLKADSVDRGLSLARAEKPDLILLDLLFPIKSGYEILKELKHMFSIVILSNLPKGSIFEPGQSELLVGVPYLIKSHHSPSEVVKFVKRFLKKKNKI